MKIVADGNIPFVKDCFTTVGEVKVVPGRQITPEVLAYADCLLVRSVTKVNEKLLTGSSVRFVATATIGFEHIDTEYLAKNKIGFASAPGSNANSVAEYIVAALLSVGEKHGIKLEGKSIGIVGVGNVGSRVEKKCAALGMKVLLNDPPLARLAEGGPPLQRQTNDLKYLPIEKLYGCDFITFHTPLVFEGIDKTFHLADEKLFKSLKTGCVFINTSRGGVMDTQALKAAIKSGKFTAAILDVWENEPNIDAELLRMVDIGTPHIAGYSYDGKIAGMIMIYEAACKFFKVMPQRTIADYLPAPLVPEIRIENSNKDEQEILHETVQQIYPMNRDDFNTREILTVEQQLRGKFFDDLRKNYPVRREFQNTKVIIADSGPSTSLRTGQRVAYKLEGIGFKVKRQK